MQKLNRHALICSIIFSIAAMAGIVFLSANKVVTISGVEQSGQEQLTQEESGMHESGDKHLLSVLGDEKEQYLTIPVPANCKAEDVVIENHYMDHELCIHIENVEESFFLENQISGNPQKVMNGRSEQQGKGVRILFDVDSYYEYRTVLENDNLYITFVKPKEEFARIVVIDPSCGGRSTGKSENGVKEKEVVLNVAKKMQEQLEEKGIRAYFTRLGDVNPSEQSRIELANEIGADMYIRIQVAAYEDASIYGVSTVYNENYFIPGFGNVELADALEREVVTSVRGKAIGLEKAGETDGVLRQVTIPAAAINIGCISNKQEAILLQREDYQEKIANGIVNAIISSSDAATP